MGLSQSFLGLTARQILVPQPQIKPGPPAVKAPSPNHWTPGSPMIQVSLQSSIPASSSLFLGSAFSADPITPLHLLSCASPLLLHIICWGFQAWFLHLYSFFGRTARFAGLVPQPRVEPAPPALEAQSHNCWTTRAVPGLFRFWLLRIMLL